MKTLNIFSKFILWLKKLFHRVLPKKKADEITQPPEPERISPQTSPKDEPSDVKQPKEKTSEVLPEQETISKPLLNTQEEIMPVKPQQKSDEEEKSKTLKPYIKKTPTKEREDKPVNSSKDEKKPDTSKQKREIDLGSTVRKRQKSTKQAQRTTEVSPEKTETNEKKTTIIESPFVEIDLDEAKVFLIIPKQQFKFSTTTNIPQLLQYELELNGQKYIHSVKVNNDEQGIIKVAEERIELKEPLDNFKVVYPDELQGRIYSYQHSNKNLYVFIGKGNNRGRMHYLYKEGKINPIPKRRDVWILLNENFELITEPDVIEERWVWENYRPLRINLKDTNELIIKKKGQTNEEEKIPCETTFSIEGKEIIEDDFKEQSPIFTGESIKIKAPGEKQDGWVVWIQNKQAGYRIIDNWRGDEPLELKLPDDLPCECGEFQVDICEQGDRIPIDTLFFRYIPYLQLEFPRELIIPDPNIGHKEQTIKILLKKDFQDWELKVDKKIQPNRIGNGYQIELLCEQDILRFSLMKQGKPETETNFKITIPRLKWKTTKNKTWCDKPIEIKREELIAGENFYLTVCTNDFDIKYDFSAILEANGKKLQEAKFIRKGMLYDLLLNQFRDTIKKNNDKIMLRMKIPKEKNDVVLVDMLYIPAKEKIKPKVRGGNGKMRSGKGFSRKEIIEGGFTLRLARYLGIPFDKRRKSMYPENVEILKSLKEVNKNGNRST